MTGSQNPAALGRFKLHVRQNRVVLDCAAANALQLSSPVTVSQFLSLFEASGKARLLQALSRDDKNVVTFETSLKTPTNRDVKVALKAGPDAFTGALKFSNASDTQTSKPNGLELLERVIRACEDRLRAPSPQAQSIDEDKVWRFINYVETLDRNKSSPAPEPSTDTPQANKYKILIAEDNYANRLVLETILSRQGHRMVMAHDGKEALAFFETQDFDLVLTDLEMPKLDGMGLARQIRKRGWTGPIFAVTGHTRGNLANECEQAGIDVVLEKPFKAKSFQRAADSYFSSERQAEKHTDEVPVPSEAGLNLDIITSLKNAAGPAVINVYNAFWKSADELITRLESLVGDDLDAISKAAHGLKGAALNVGADNVAVLAKSIQDQPTQLNAETIRELYSALEDSRTRIQPMLAA